MGGNGDGNRCEARVDNLPWIPATLLRLLLPRVWRDSILAEIAEAHQQDCEHKGRSYAGRAVWMRGEL